MRHLRTFESYSESGYSYENEKNKSVYAEKCPDCNCNCDECDCDECDCKNCKNHSMSVSEKKKAKPDFLDIDKNGNKKESMKKAVKDAKSGKLSSKQKKLPEGLRKAIEKKNK